MKNAFKKNPPLFIGLMLPLLIILAFAGIPFVASFVVPAPEYNFIYSLDHYNNQGKLRVIDGKLNLEVYNPWAQPREIPQFYLADVHSKKSTKLNVALAQGENSLVPAYKTREFVIEGITLKGLDPSNIAPDGYQLTTGTNDNFFSIFFFVGGNRQNYISLHKAGRIEKFPSAGETYRGIRFEGWIIPK